MSSSLDNFLKKNMYILGCLIAVVPISVFYLYRSIRKKRLPIDTLDETLRLNSSQTSNTKTIPSTAQKASDIQPEIAPEMAEDIKPSIDEKKILSILKRISENVLNTIVMTYDLLNEDYDKATQKFKAEKITLQDLNANKFKAGSNLFYI